MLSREKRWGTCVLVGGREVVERGNARKSGLVSCTRKRKKWPIISPGWAKKKEEEKDLFLRLSAKGEREKEGGVVDESYTVSFYEKKGGAALRPSSRKEKKSWKRLRRTEEGERGKKGVVRRQL